MKKLPFILCAVLSAGMVTCSGAEEPEARTGGLAPKPAPTRRPTGSTWKPSANPKTARFLGFVAPKPATWIEHPSSSKMRAAKYTVPGRDGADAAHIVVFYFGEGQGGSVNGNITRWQSQFRPGKNGTPVQPKIERFEADGMPVTLVELQGDWMKMGATWYTDDQHFITAIVETPIGNLFIRFAGDMDTVGANREEFVTMIRGLEKE